MHAADFNGETRRYSRQACASNFSPLLTVRARPQNLQLRAWGGCNFRLPGVASHDAPAMAAAGKGRRGRRRGSLCPGGWHSMEGSLEEQWVAPQPRVRG